MSHLHHFIDNHVFNITTYCLYQLLLLLHQILVKKRILSAILNI